MSALITKESDMVTSFKFSVAKTLAQSHKGIVQDKHKSRGSGRELAFPYFANEQLSEAEHDEFRSYTILSENGHKKNRKYRPEFPKDTQ